MNAQTQPSAGDTAHNYEAALNAAFGPQCGLNGDWSVQAWCVRHSGEGANRGVGIYVLDNEDDTLSIARRNSESDDEPEQIGEPMPVDQVANVITKAKGIPLTEASDLRVVLTGDGEWRGTFIEWVDNNADSLSIAEVQEAADALQRHGFHPMNMGAGGMFLLRLETDEERKTRAALSLAFVAVEETLRDVVMGSASREDVMNAGRICSTAIDQLKRGGVR